MIVVHCTGAPGLPFVDSDFAGNSPLKDENTEFSRRIETLYRGLKLPALRRHGETDDKTEELI